jgi:excisionase family DNA binding protein
MSSHGRLLRVGEAAELGGVDARQVYEAIDAGVLAARHVEGHGVRLAREDVDAFGDTL